MEAQSENIHLAPFPYLADEGDAQSLWWENSGPNKGAVGVYAHNSGANIILAGVGYAAVLNATAQVVAEVKASASFEEYPMLYHSFNTTKFDKTKTYDANGQASWGVLQQIVDGFPKYIPKVMGNLVPFREVSAKWLSAASPAEIQKAGSGS